MAHHPHARERNFGFVFSALFALVSVYAVSKGNNWGFWTAPLAPVLLMLALIYPAVLDVPSRLWLRFGELLERIVSPVVLGIIFLLTIAPVGFLLRVFGKDILNIRRPATTPPTYWRPRVDPMQSMKKQF